MTRMTDQIGRVLGGRYRLLAPLGSGASAQVYLADDVRLRRRVAVKVLHPGLADDESFLRRFRGEAQAAAALSHPHVLAVYDWSDDESPYLVTEYLAGGSLRSMLDAGHRLSPAQALVIGLEAARALDYAHRRGFVHRDIKPANLLFGDDGRLRVADFGLARAIAEAGWTEPTGAVLGTVRYASPEQARGQPVDGRSDVYSLALVLVEAVTAQVPFTVDTTIGTLMARLDHGLEVPDGLGPLAPVLTAAGKLDVAERLDAAALGAGLVAAAPRLARPEPLPLVGADVSEAPPTDSRDATLLGPTVQPPVLASAEADGGAVAAAPATTAAGRGAEGRQAGGEPTEVLAEAPDRGPAGPGAGPPGGLPAGAMRWGAGRSGPPPGAPTLPGPSPWSTAEGPRPRLSPGDRSVRRLMLGAVVVALAVAGGALVAGLYMRAQVPKHTIPTSLIGATKQQVISGLADKGWVIKTKEVRKDGTQPNEVLATDPRPGTELAEGKILTLTVSLGPTLVPVPPGIVGASEEDAIAALAGAGLVEQSVRQPSDTVPEGVVIGFAEGKPSAAGLPKGSTVKLNISAGQKVVVPDVAGMPQAGAQAQLEGLGLRVELRGQRAPGDRQPGEVISTDPGAGSDVDPGSTVVLVVAVDGVQVPPLLGLSKDDAHAALESVGLRLGRTIGADEGVVILAVPREGTVVEPGTSVDVVMRRTR